MKAKIDAVLKYITPLVGIIITLAIFTFNSHINTLKEMIALEKQDRKEADNLIISEIKEIRKDIRYYILKRGK
jgi:hypothetical protein